MISSNKLLILDPNFKYEIRLNTDSTQVELLVYVTPMFVDTSKMHPKTYGLMLNFSKWELGIYQGLPHKLIVSKLERTIFGSEQIVLGEWIEEVSDFIEESLCL